MLRIGILIAGSLYWSDASHRVQWRRAHLRQGSEISVSTPIRYGRRSSTGSFTMVFAPGCPPGQAKILECLQSTNTFADLVREAQALWLAESRDGAPKKPTETLASEWGCVVLLANPASALPKSLLHEWAARVGKETHRKTQARFYDSLAYAVNGTAAISDAGELQIEWPGRADTGAKVGSLDILLATATKPTPEKSTGDYPTAEQIAAAWLKTGDPQYFVENRKHGFHTFQDDKIQKHL